MAETALQKQENQTGLATPEDAQGVTLMPRVDILETEHELLLLADLPGVKAEDVDVRFENGELALHGRRAASYNDKRQAGREYAVGNYFRTFRVTEKVAADRISAELKNGVLTVHLPKTEAAKPRRVTVRGE